MENDVLKFVFEKLLEHAFEEGQGGLSVKKSHKRFDDGSIETTLHFEVLDGGYEHGESSLDLESKEDMDAFAEFVKGIEE